MNDITPTVEIRVTPSSRGFRLRCSCGCLDVPDVPEAEVGMLARIHFDASHESNGSYAGEGS